MKRCVRKCKRERWTDGRARAPAEGASRRAENSKLPHSHAVGCCLGHQKTTRKSTHPCTTVGFGWINSTEFTIFPPTSLDHIKGICHKTVTPNESFVILKHRKTHPCTLQPSFLAHHSVHSTTRCANSNETMDTSPHGTTNKCLWQIVFVTLRAKKNF